MKSERVVVRRALIGVSDKAGLADFARVLARHGVEIVSTGGTAAALEAAGIKVRGVENFTGSPQLLAGGVKPVHPKSYGRGLGRGSGRTAQPANAADAIQAMVLVGGDFLTVGRTRHYRENRQPVGAHYGRFRAIDEQPDGRELSFNNVFDISSAVNVMLDFTGYKDAVVAILKHNTPCGVGVGATLLEAWEKAFATDPDSPFGGIIIANRPWDLPFAEAVDELFTEVLIGAAFEPGVLEFLRKKKNRRVIRFHPEAGRRDDLDLKRGVGWLLVQTPDLSLEDPREGKVVTRRAPTPGELRAMDFGIRVCKHIKSNAIAFVAEDRTLAVGCGATSPIDPLYAAREKAARLKTPLQASLLGSQ